MAGRIALASALLLGACAGTPDEMRALGATATLGLARPPSEAAECALPFIDETYNSTNVLRRTPVGYTVLGASGGDNLWTIDFTPSGSGSAVSIYVSDNAIARGSVSRKLSNAILNCR